MVERVVTSVIEYGEIQRPYLGVRYTEINERVQELHNLPIAYGALVSSGDAAEDAAVLPGSPADEAGIIENDIITAVDGQSLADRSLASILRDKAVGDSMIVDLLRQGEVRSVTVRLQKMP